MSSIEKTNQEKIAVIGAGPMGLAVAYQLVKDGFKPVIFETDDRIGGMSASFDFDGMTIDRFYHFHCTSDNAFFQILSELGIESKLHWKETKMGYYHKGSVHSWGNPIALLSFPGLSLFAKIRYGIHVFLSTKRNEWHSLDRINAITWLNRWIGKEAYEKLWSKLFDYKFYEYSDQISAAWIWSRIRRVGRSRYNIFQEKSGYLEDGSKTLLQAMKNYIEEKGGDIRVSTKVNKIVIEKDAVKGLHHQDGFEQFSKVISTIPIPYVPSLIPDLPEAIIAQYESIKSVAIVCVIVKLKKKVTNNFWMNVNDPDMEIPGFVEYTNLRPMGQHLVYVPYYIPDNHPKFKESNQVFIDEVKKYLKVINPDLCDDDFLSVYANRYRYAQPVCTPGFLHKLPPVSLPVRGLWVADTSYYYPEDRGMSESIGFGRELARKAMM
jgi:protoporphyrinogen oxidase